MMWGSYSCRCGPGIHIASFYQQDCQVCAAPRGAPTPVSTICDHHNSGTTSTGGLGCTRGQDVTMTHQQMHATSLHTQQPMQKSHSATPLHHQHPHTKPRTCNHSMHGQTRVLDTSRSECPCKAFRALCASHARECTTKPQTHPKQHATTAAVATARAQLSSISVCWNTGRLPPNNMQQQQQRPAPSEVHSRRLQR